MPTYQFEAMDSTGQEIKDVIEAASQEEAQATIRQMGYFVTKISVKKARKAAAEKGKGSRKRAFAIGGVKSKVLTAFTRQLSILQDAGLPIVVISVAVGILTFIMIKIVPSFQKIFEDFGTSLPVMTTLLITISSNTVKYWYLIPGLPISFWLFIKLLRKFKAGRIGWDMFT